MDKMNMKELIIGDLTARIPIIQGGMGVGISLSSLASAVANQEENMKSYNSDQVFAFHSNQLKGLPFRSYREGFLNTNLENSLQKLIELHPQILSGAQMYPGRSNPPRFFILKSEILINGWSLDLLLVDQEGVLTLVETKLKENTESRRAVIGQILDYAANATESWISAKLRNMANGYWSSRQESLNDKLRSFLEGEEVDVDAFWNSIDENLKRNKIRLIIAADQLQPETRSVIEFLNNEFKTAEILGLELTCYGESADDFVIVPRIIGQTQETSLKVSATTSYQQWPYDLLKDKYKDYENRQLGGRLMTILDWAQKNGRFIESKTKTPSFGISNIVGKRVLSFWDTGKIYCVMDANTYNDDETARDYFVSDLNELSFTNYPIGKIDNGRDSIGSLAEVHEGEIDKLLSILDRHLVDR